MNRYSHVIKLKKRSIFSFLLIQPRQFVKMYKFFRQDNSTIRAAIIAYRLMITSIKTHYKL